MNRCRGRQSSREPDILERRRARGTLPAGRKARARHHVSKQGSQLPRKTAAQEQPEEERREKVSEREREREKERGGGEKDREENINVQRKGRKRKRVKKEI